MKNLCEQDKTEQWDTLLLLARSCPLGPVNPANCPLNPIRKLALPERLQWFRTLTEDDLQYLVELPLHLRKSPATPRRRRTGGVNPPGRPASLCGRIQRDLRYLDESEFPE